MPVSRKDPKFAYLIVGTYGLVILTTALAVGAYFYYSSNQPAGKSLDETGSQRTVPIGKVWVNIYPGSRLQPAETRVDAGPAGEVTEGEIHFATADAPDQVLSYYREQLSGVGYLVSDAPQDQQKEEAAGGSMQAVRLGGRIRVLVTVSPETEGDGASITSGVIRTFSTGDEDSP